MSKQYVQQRNGCRNFKKILKDIEEEIKPILKNSDNYTEQSYANPITNDIETSVKELTPIKEAEYTGLRKSREIVEEELSKLPE